MIHSVFQIKMSGKTILHMRILAFELAEKNNAKQNINAEEKRLVSVAYIHFLADIRNSEIQN